jgi:hypothetical protein
MDRWRHGEEAEKGIELRRKTIRRAKGEQKQQWLEKYVYVCSREGTGGRSQYKRKCNRGRKIPSKRTGCACLLVVKVYPGTDTVLGRYEAEHDHEIGAANLRYTRLPVETRVQIAEMLRMGISRDRVVRCFILPASMLWLTLPHSFQISEEMFIRSITSRPLKLSSLLGRSLLVCEMYAALR